MKTSMNFMERISALERAAENFYRKQAQLQCDLEAKNVLESIAEEEAHHADYILSLAAEPAKVVVFEASADVAGPVLYPLVDLHEQMARGVFALDSDLEIFDVALALEKKTVVFYRRLLDAIREPVIRDGIRDVFVKEKGHFGKIRELRKARSASPSFYVKPLFTGM